MFYVSSGIHFLVGLTQNSKFDVGKIITFDKIITNVGGGYIDDVNNTDYGKFIAPGNGTYQFNAITYSTEGSIGADLFKNEERVTVANNGREGSGSGSLSVVLDLKAGDQVFLRQPHWVSEDAVYDKYVTTFSGVLIRAGF